MAEGSQTFHPEPVRVMEDVPREFNAELVHQELTFVVGWHGKAAPQNAERHQVDLEGRPLRPRRDVEVRREGLEVRVAAEELPGGQSVRPVVGAMRAAGAVWVQRRWEVFGNVHVVEELLHQPVVEERHTRCGTESILYLPHTSREVGDMRPVGQHGPAESQSIHKRVAARRAMLVFARPPSEVDPALMVVVRQDTGSTN